MNNVAAHCLILLAGWSGVNLAQAKAFEQSWECTLLPGHSLEELQEVTAEWQRAAQAMPGGDGLQVTLRWPIVVADSADRFQFVVRTPSLAAWGTFYDGYDSGSGAGRVDERFARVATCSGSTVWELIEAP